MKAINKSLKYMQEHTTSEVADMITAYFPDTSYNDLVSILDRYTQIDSWFKTTHISEEDFEHVQEIVENAGELTKKAPYSDLITNEFE